MARTAKRSTTKKSKSSSKSSSARPVVVKVNINASAKRIRPLAKRDIAKKAIAKKSLAKSVAKKVKAMPKRMLSRKTKARIKATARARKVTNKVKKVKASTRAKPLTKAQRALQRVRAGIGAGIEETPTNTSEKINGRQEQVLKQRAPLMPNVSTEGKLNMQAIKMEVQRELSGISTQEDFALPKRTKGIVQKIKGKEYILTGIPGFDDLLIEGIPKGGSIIVAGGTGSGKTIFLLQIMNNAALAGKKCLYMSFEESDKRLRDHMTDFGWDPNKLEKKGLIKIQRFNPFDITRSVDAMLAKAKGELLIDVEPLILPKGFKPDYVFLDSLTAIAAAFSNKADSYRIYIEQLFRFFEKIGSTSFLITETEQIPKIFSPTGVEEFLADGVVVLYAIRHENVKEHAVEILKLRGASHKKTIASMQIIGGRGIVIYPEQEVFSDIEEKD